VNQRLRVIPDDVASPDEFFVTVAGSAAQSPGRLAQPHRPD
jgi:hypothetical protein